ILVIDKTAGATSFDAGALARKRLGVRRIGPAGTLDPPATGVLPLLVGEATKLTPYLMDQDKEYVTTVRFGVTTDTHDLTGRVLSETAVTGLTRERLEAACRGFVGRITQVPPMYSAVHHEGRRLYELAREGVEVQRRRRTALRPRPGGGRGGAGGGGDARARVRRDGRPAGRGRSGDDRPQHTAGENGACGSSGAFRPSRLSAARARSPSASSTASISAIASSSARPSLTRAPPARRRWRVPSSHMPSRCSSPTARRS